MKNLFEEPVINVQVFVIEDILTTSGDDLGDGGLDVAP